MVNKNGLAVLAYFFGVIGALIVYLISEKKDKYVRFHAVQSILFNITTGIVWVIITIATLPFMIFGGSGMFPNMGLLSVLGVYGLVIFIVWIVLLVNAWNGKKYKLPVIGDWADQWSR